MLTEGTLEICPICGIKTCKLVHVNDNGTGQKICLKCKRKIKSK